MPEEELGGAIKTFSPYFSPRGWCPQSWAGRGRRKGGETKRKSKTGLIVTASKGKQREKLGGRAKEKGKPKEKKDDEEGVEGETEEGRKQHPSPDSSSPALWGQMSSEPFID